jgi:AbiTii
VHLTTKYQENFIHHHTLLRAWQSLPGSVIIALLETVRNRVLRFALEMKKSAGGDDKLLSTEDVGAIVDRQIFSGKKFDWT